MLRIKKVLLFLVFRAQGIPRTSQGVSHLYILHNQSFISVLDKIWVHRCVHFLCLESDRSFTKLKHTENTDDSLTMY